MSISKGLKLADLDLNYLGRHLWNKIDTSGTNGECWEWQGTRWFGGDKYGRIEIRTKEGVPVRTSPHRIVYLLTHGGEIPPKMCICHTCDNPPCCRPDHLWLGTYGDNLHDCIDKGRFIPNMKRGEEHGIAKLTWEEVKAIRRRYSDGETQDALADAFGSSQANVRRIIQNEQWVVENPDWIVRENHWWPGRRGEDNNFTRLTQKQVDEIRERYKRGERQKELAKAFGVNHGTISLIIRNETWVVENPVVTSRGQEHIRGDDNPTAKLTFRKARKIRELSKDGWTYKELKEEFGVETGTISRVLRNQRWIDKDYKPRPPIPRSERWKMRVRYREENGVKNGISGT